MFSFPAALHVRFRASDRGPPKGVTSGWYIWCGEVWEDTPDFFFVPLHTQHFYENHPETAKLLGLTPGYRLLLAAINSMFGSMLRY